MFIPNNSEEMATIYLDGKPSSYLVSSRGIIVNTDYRMSGQSCILKQTTNRYGYKTVCLYSDKIRKTYKVHRLVALAFIPNPLNLKEVNHINGNKNDNSVGNLEWCDRTQNMRHAVKYGLHYALKGEEHPGALCSNEQAHAVCKYLEEGLLPIYEISKKTGVKRETISRILHKRSFIDISDLYNISDYNSTKLRSKFVRQFTDEQIRDVCNALVNHERPLYKIAENTGVSYNVVKLINLRRYPAYAHIYNEYDY